MVELATDVAVSPRLRGETKLSQYAVALYVELFNE